MQLLRDIRARFGTNKVIFLVLVVVVVGALAGSGWLLFQHRTTSSPNTPGYLDIKEWGIKLPLSNGIKDAYYVVSNSSHDPASGEPNTVWLGLASLNRNGCDASLANQGQDTELGTIVRGSPTDTDPIDGTPFSKLYPGGITIGKYYYAYSSRTTGRRCASQETLTSIDSAFSEALRNAILDSTK